MVNRLSNLERRFTQIQNSRDVNQLNSLKADFRNQEQQLRNEALALESKRRTRLEEQKLREVRNQLRRAKGFQNDIEKRTRNIRGVTIGPTRGEIRQQEKLKNLEKAREAKAKQQRIKKIVAKVERRKAEIKVEKARKALDNFIRKGQRVTVGEIRKLGLTPQSEKKFTKNIVITTTRKDREVAFLNSIKDADFTKYNAEINKRLAKGKAIDFQVAEESFKVQTNQYLRATGTAPVPFSKPVSEFEKKLKQRDKVIQEVTKNVQQIKLSDTERLNNKLITGQTVTPTEKRIIQYIAFAEGKEITKAQAKGFKNLALSPVLYGKNLRARFEKGERNPLGNDLSKIFKGFGKEVGDTINFFLGVKGVTINSKGQTFDGVIAKGARALLTYQQKLIRSYKNEGTPLTVIKKDLLSAAEKTKEFGKATVEVSKFVAQNPVLSAGIVALAIESGVISSRDAFLKNPQENFGRALFWLAPTKVFTGGGKLVVKTSQKLAESSSKALKVAKNKIKNAKTPQALKKAILDAKIAIEKYNLQRRKATKVQVLSKKEAAEVEKIFKRFEKKEGIRPTSKKSITQKDVPKLLGFDATPTPKITPKPAPSAPTPELSIGRAQARIDSVTNNKKALKSVLRELNAFGFAVTKQKLPQPIIDLINGQVLTVRFIVTKKKAPKPKVRKGRKFKKALKKQKEKQFKKEMATTKLVSPRGLDFGVPKAKAAELERFRRTKEQYNKLNWAFIFRQAEKIADIKAGRVTFKTKGRAAFTIIEPELKTRKSFDKFGKKAQAQLFSRANKNVETATKEVSKGLKKKKKGRRAKLKTLRGRKAKKVKVKTKKDRQQNRRNEIVRLETIRKELEVQKKEVQKEIKTIEVLEKKIKTAQKISPDFVKALAGALKVLQATKQELKQELAQLISPELKKVNTSINKLKLEFKKAQKLEKAQDKDRPTVKRLVSKAKKVRKIPRKPAKPKQVKKVPSKTKKPTIARIKPKIVSKIKRIPSIRLNLKGLQKKGSRKGYIVRVKEANKIVSQTTTLLPRNRAINLGRRRVDNNLRASFDIVPKGKTPIVDVKNVVLSSKFRQKRSKGTKVLTNVEKRKFRLDTKGERRRKK